MGATAGHMLHPYENLELSFDEMRGIFDVASKGFPKLKVTEKTDGQNIAIGYDPKSGEALAIRNKSHAMAGGLDKEKLKRYFTTDRIEANKSPTPLNVVDSFYDAMQNFEKIARSLPPEFFVTPAGERIFYNAEVMDPRSANVVDYDTQVLLIHRVGHKKLTSAGMVSFEASEAEQRSIELENRLQELQETSPEISTIKVNAIVNFTDFIERKEAYRDAINELRIVQGPAKTVGEYLRNEIRKQLDAAIGKHYLPETYEKMVDALMRFAEYSMPRKTIEIKAVLATVPDESKHEFIKEFLTTRGTMKPVVDRAMRPLVMIVHRFATKILEGFISGYTLQSDVSLEKLRKKVGAKARELSDPGDLNILKTSLAKIHGGEDVGDVLDDGALESALEKITTSVEGLVFDYNGKTYKFTGQFAPINQMLGLGKYDRGSKETVSEAMEFGSIETIGLVPMAAKPYHAGHHALITIAAKQNDKVIVFISTSNRTRPEEFPIYGADMERIWKEEIEKILPSNVMPIYGGSPVRNVYEVLGQANEEVTDTNYIIYSDPTDTEINYPICNRLKYFPELYEKGLVMCAAEISPDTFTRGVGTPDVSGTKLRAALQNKDFETFAAGMPTGVDAEKIFRILRREVQEQKKTFSLLYSLVEEVLDEKKKTNCFEKGKYKTFDGKSKCIQRTKGLPKERADAYVASVLRDMGEIEEMSSMAAGSVVGPSGGGPISTPTRNKRDEEDLVDEVLNYLLNIH